MNKKLLFLILLFTYNLSAQIVDVGNKVLVKGIITDLNTGVPVGTNIEIKDNQGKKIKIFSNSKTGAYEQLLPAGEYEILFQNWNVARSFDKMTVKPLEKFGEQVFNYKVKFMQPRSLFDSLAIFPKNESIAGQDLNKYLEDLKVQMKYNRGVDFEFIVTSSDITPETKVIEAKSQTKSKNKKAPATEQKVEKPVLNKDVIKTLVDKRIEFLKSKISDWGAMGSRISFTPKYEQCEYISPNSVVVLVKKVEDLFK